MIASGIVQKLNAQMNQEFYTSNLYLQLSQRCSENSLNGTALFLRHQAQNTVTQMMRMYEYIKQSGATPVLQEQHARCGEFSTLEDLFEQTVSDYQKRINALTSLTEDAQAANDKSAINFLKRYRKEEIVDGTLLQIILDEVRSAKKAVRDTDTPSVVARASPSAKRSRLRQKLRLSGRNKISSGTAIFTKLQSRPHKLPVSHSRALFTSCGRESIR